jgi:RNA polymerase sigma factor (TIGR02999 family)
MSEVTHILSAIQQGDPRAAEQLLPLVYDELRQLAAARMAHEKPGQTLVATALVHEVYLRLVGDQKFDGRGHFFAAAAEAMRRILVENARRKKRARHGGDRQRVDLNSRIALDQKPDDLLELDEALGRLAAHDASAAELVKSHFFAGVPIEQVGQTLGTGRAVSG